MTKRTWYMIMIALRNYNDCCFFLYHLKKRPNLKLSLSEYQPEIKLLLSINYVSILCFYAILTITLCFILINLFLIKY